MIIIAQIRGMLCVSEIVCERISSMTRFESHVRRTIWRTREKILNPPRDSSIAVTIQRKPIYHSASHIHRGIQAPQVRHFPPWITYEIRGMSSYHASIFLQEAHWLLPVQNERVREVLSISTAEKLPTHAPIKKMKQRRMRDIGKRFMG